MAAKRLSSQLAATAEAARYPNPFVGRSVWLADCTSPTSYYLAQVLQATAYFFWLAHLGLDVCFDVGVLRFLTIVYAKHRVGADEYHDPRLKNALIMIIG